MWPFRKHEHSWKMGSKTWSMTPGYKDSTVIERCTKCPATRTVYEHECSKCGHKDTKRSYVKVF